MTWCQDEVCRSRALFYFLDANFVERVTIDVCTAHFPTNISHHKCLFKEFYAIDLTRRASSLAKVGYMASTWFCELSRANLYPSLVWDTLSHSDPSCHCWNRLDGSGFCESYWLCWGHGHQRLGWSLSESFWRVHPKDLKSTRLGIWYSQRDCLEDPRLTLGTPALFYLGLARKLTFFLKELIEVMFFLKKRSCKWGMVRKSSASCMYQNDLTLLAGLQVWDDWLEPRGTNPCRTCHCPKAFLGLLGVSQSFFFGVSKLI